MRPTRTTRGLICMTAAGFATGCGGQGLDVRGPEALILFAEYSGVWVLDTLSSDEMPRLSETMAEGRGGRGGDDPFGGGGRRGGGAPPDGRGGRGGVGPGGGGAPGGLNVAAMRATMELASVRPERIELHLTDSLFVLTERRSAQIQLPMNGDEIELSRGEWPLKAKVRWDDRKPRVERSVDEGGTVVDRYELLAPNRLLVSRAVDAGLRGDVELSFVYDREGGER